VNAEWRGIVGVNPGASIQREVKGQFKALEITLRKRVKNLKRHWEDDHEEETKVKSSRNLQRKWQTRRPYSIRVATRTGDSNKKAGEWTWREKRAEGGERGPKTK